MLVNFGELLKLIDCIDNDQIYTLKIKEKLKYTMYVLKYTKKYTNI